MENNLRKLKAVLNMLGIKKFYTLNITEYALRLQGEYNSDLVKILLSTNKYSTKIDSNGYTSFKRSNIEIILT